MTRSSTAPTVLWFRRDLRLADHPALLDALAENRDVLGVFVADDTVLIPSGAPRRAFLAGCLERLSASLDGRLLITHGHPSVVIPEVAKAVGASAVHISADYGPYGRRRDARVEKALAELNVQLMATGSPYAVAPGRVRKPDGSPYAVFTPYFRGWTAHGWRRPAKPAGTVDWLDPAAVHGAPRLTPADIGAPVSSSTRLPEPGEAAAQETWRDFLQHNAAPADRPSEPAGTYGIDSYQDQRDRPDHPGTSRMSPYLKWGCIHPRTMLADLAERGSAGASAYRRELAWREFYADVVFHRPGSLWTSIDPVVDILCGDTGRVADERLAAWKAGRTGYPYIDAGMRQLISEGWVHNRVRMGVASFLVKDLHLPWQLGAAYFLEHLVDGDYASNNHGWQWVAGSGPQAAAFYRIFNPVGQGEKFDPNGDYVRRFVPELRDIPGKAVHKPWELPPDTAPDYPAPIVEHAAERAETLRRWESRPRG